MKTMYKKIGLMLAMFSTLASCEVLDVEPKYVMAPENFYQTESELVYGLTGVYGVMNTEPFYGNFYSLMISNVDDLCYQNRVRTGSEPYFYTHTSSNTNIYRAWSMIYAGIKNANEYMEAIDGNSLDPDKKYYAEARFLRAYYHFVLAQAWGDVPLRTSAVKSPANVELAATAQKDVLLWCANEMEGALTFFTENDVELMPYRVTRSAIQGILSRVYMFLAGESVEGVTNKDEMWAKAAEYAFDVIESTDHRLNPSYSDVFINMIGDKSDNVYRESIWEVEFMGTHTAASWSNGRIGDLIGLQSAGTDNKYGDWACNYSYAWYNGSLKLWDLYWDEDRTDAQDKSTTEISDTRQVWNMPSYNYAGFNSLGLVQSYDKSPYSYDGKNTFNEITTAVGKRNAGKFRREVEYEGQMSAKELYTGINFPVLRYSDVLLMYAEAVNEAPGNVAVAYPYVKEVRDRAQIETRPVGEYDQASMRQLIRNERGRELAFEALRKYDLIRWGIFVEQMQGYNEQASDPRWNLDGTAARVKETANNIQEKHIVLPIPATELGVNKLLKQNQMW